MANLVTGFVLGAIFGFVIFAIIFITTDDK